MLWKVVLKGEIPSGRILAVLYARTGETIDVVRELLNSPRGMLLQSGLSKEKAEKLIDSLPDDGSVEMFTLPDQDICIPVLMGYRPGNRGRLRVALQKLSGLSTEEVIKFIGSIPIVLKLDSDRNTAEQIKSVLERSGGIVEIRAKEELDTVVNRRQQKRKKPEVKVAKKVESSSKSAEELLPEYIDAPPFASVESVTEFSSEFVRPSVICFQPPEVVSEASPPVSENPLDDIRFSTPYKFSFTIPASLSPAVTPEETKEVKVPYSSKLREVVLLYLFPVSKSNLDKVVKELCLILNYSESRVLSLINMAPVPLIGFNKRADALLSVAELSRKGIPVSLVADTSSVSHTSHKSLLGWLNGYGRTT